MRSAAVAAALLLAPAPGSAADRELRVLAEDAVVAPATPLAKVEVARLADELDRWRAQRAAAQLRAFAEVGDPDEPGSTEIVRVHDLRSLPPNTVSRFLVVLDEQRRPRILEETPTSVSADGATALTHFFDETGRTVGFVRASEYAGPCGEPPTRERSAAFFGPGGRLLGREYAVRDGSGKPLPAAGCQPARRDPYRIHSDAAAALRAARLVPAALAAGVRLTAGR